MQLDSDAPYLTDSDVDDFGDLSCGNCDDCNLCDTVEEHYRRFIDEEEEQEIEEESAAAACMAAASSFDEAGGSGWCGGPSGTITKKSLPCIWYSEYLSDTPAYPPRQFREVFRIPLFIGQYTIASLRPSHCSSSGVTDLASGALPAIRICCLLPAPGNGQVV